MTEAKNVAYWKILLLLFLTSVAVSYWKYMIKEDFAYFLSEDEIPSAFEKGNYPELNGIYGDD